MADILGTAIAVPGQPEREWSRAGGNRFFHTWHGPTKDSIDTVAAGLSAAAYSSYQIFSPDGATWKLRAEIGNATGEGNPDIVDDWELDGASQMADVMVHPRAMAIGLDVLATIVDAVNNPVPGVTPTLTGDSLSLYKLLVQGQKSYFIGNHVLRHTLTVGATSQVSVLMEGILQIWAWADMPDSEMPDHILAAGGSIPTPATIPDGYVWGWLKMPTKIKTSMFAKTVVVEEWILDVWPEFLYEVAAFTP
jgi:hypothetical protein